MTVLDEVIATLRRILQLDEASRIDANTRLLGGIPEFDSLAVASVVIGLEEQFGLKFDDEDISVELFETVGTLAAFVEQSRSSANDNMTGPKPSFLSTSSGELYVLRRDPPVATSRCVLFVPPFAEEMNRVRAIVSGAAQALNEMGLSCCFFDLFGTGDSDGDFADARWAGWLSDIDEVMTHLGQEGFSSIDIVGIRLGALLTIEYLAGNGHNIDRLVLWDPVIDAGRYLDQFLRTRTMAAMMAGQSETVDELRRRLNNGEIVEVGGYALHPELAAILDGLPQSGPRDLKNVALTWISRDADAETVAQTTGLQLSRIIRAGYEPYWSSIEHTSARALIQATCETLK